MHRHDPRSKFKNIKVEKAAFHEEFKGQISTVSSPLRMAGGVAAGSMIVSFAQCAAQVCEEEEFVSMDIACQLLKTTFRTSTIPRGKRRT